MIHRYGASHPPELLLSVIIPAFNEETRILPTLDQVVEYLSRQPYSWEVLVVDDGSSDSTASLVGQFADSHDHVKLITVPHQGKGWAVQRGMLEASGQYRFFCDADLSMPIEQLSRFLPQNLSSFDIAIGSREAAEAQRFNEPLLRYLMGRIFNRITRLLMVRNISDTQCGFKCFRGEVAQDLFSLQRLHGFSFDIEILFLAQLKGLHIVEIPIDWYYRGESKVQRLKDTLLMLRDFLRIRTNHLLGKYGKLKKGGGPPSASF